MITQKTLQVELAFHGTGAVVEESPQEFYGGVVEPTLGDEFTLEIWPEILDEDGNLNPPAGAETVLGSFQVSLSGTAAAYRELGRYLLGVAELDTTADPGFHEHHELSSSDGRTRLHIIVRKRPG